MGKQQFSRDVLFIREVRKHECVYNTALRYSRKGSPLLMKRKAALEEIAEVLTKNGYAVSAADCAARWRCIRDNFNRNYQRKCLKASGDSEGSSEGTTPSWKLWPHMQWYLTHAQSEAQPPTDIEMDIGSLSPLIEDAIKHSPRSATSSSESSEQQPSVTENGEEEKTDGGTNSYLYSTSTGPIHHSTVVDADEHYFFAMQLVPSLRSLPAHVSIKLKADIMVMLADTVAKEHDTVAKEHDTVAKERDTVAKEHDTVAKEHDTFANEHGQASAQAGLPEGDNSCDVQAVSMGTD